MCSNGSANELLASMMPQSPGIFIDTDFTEDWQMENGDVYTITVVPGSEWQAVDAINREAGAPGAPITFTREVADNNLPINAGGIVDMDIAEPTDDQYCGVFSSLVKQAQESGIQSVTITPAIGDSTARLSELFPLQYEEGAGNSYTFRLSTAVDPRTISIEVKAKPIGNGWCTLTASDGTNKTSSYAGGPVSNAWGGVNFPDRITIKGSSDQAGTEGVYTLKIEEPTT